MASGAGGASTATGIRTPAPGIRGRCRPPAADARSRSASGFAADPGSTVSTRLGPPRPAGSERRCSADAARWAVRDPVTGLPVGGPGRRGWRIRPAVPGVGGGDRAPRPRAIEGTTHPSLLQVRSPPTCSQWRRGAKGGGLAQWAGGLRRSLGLITRRSRVRIPPPLLPKPDHADNESAWKQP